MDKRILIEAYIEDNKIKVKVVQANSKGIPFLTHALKLIELEVSKQLIEMTKQDKDIIVVPQNELQDILARN